MATWGSAPRWVIWSEMSDLSEVAPALAAEGRQWCPRVVGTGQGSWEACGGRWGANFRTTVRPFLKSSLTACPPLALPNRPQFVPSRCLTGTL